MRLRNGFLFLLAISLLSNSAYADFLSKLKESVSEIGDAIEEAAAEIEQAGTESDDAIETSQASTPTVVDANCEVPVAGNKLNDVSPLGMFVGQNFECAMRKAASDEVLFAFLNKAETWDKDDTCSSKLADWQSYGHFPGGCAIRISRSGKVGYSGTFTEGMLTEFRADNKTGAIESVLLAAQVQVDDVAACEKLNADFVASIEDELGEPNSKSTGWGYTTRNSATLRYMVGDNPANVLKNWHDESPAGSRLEYAAELFYGCQEGPAVISVIHLELSGNKLEPLETAALVSSDSVIPILTSGEDVLDCEVVQASALDKLSIRGFRMGTNFECFLPLCETKSYASASQPSNSEMTQSVFTTADALSQWEQLQLFPGSLQCGYKGAKIDKIGVAGYDSFDDYLRAELDNISGTIKVLDYTYKQPISSASSCQSQIDALIDGLTQLTGQAPGVGKTSSRGYSSDGSDTPLTNAEWTGPENEWNIAATLGCGESPAPFVYVQLRSELY